MTLAKDSGAKRTMAAETAAEAAPQQQAEQQQEQAEQQQAPKDIKFPIICPGHSRPVVDVRFSAPTEDGVFLVSGCHDKLPMLRWGDNGDWIGSFEGHKGAVWSAALNSDATRVATGSGDFSARLFDAVNGELIHSFAMKHIVKTVDFSRKDEKLLMGGNEKAIKVFDLKALDYPLLATLETKAPVAKAGWIRATGEADDTLLMCGCDDGSVQVWDTAKPEAPLKEWKVADPVTDLEVCPSQNTVTVAAGKTVYFYDMATFELRKQHDLGITVEGASLNPATGKHFVVGGSTDLWVHLFDLESGKEVRNHTGHHGPIFCLRYSPDGLTYASGSEDGTVRLWRPEAAPAATEE